VPNSLGPAELLLHYGTDEQKGPLPAAPGRRCEIPCFGLTSTTAGSDATSIADYGVVCKGQWQGQEVTLASSSTSRSATSPWPRCATVVGLAFRLYDPDGLIGDKEDIGITLALLPADTRAWKSAAAISRSTTLPQRTDHGQGRVHSARLPARRHRVCRQGWRMLIESLSVGRAISLPSSATGGPSRPPWPPALMPASASSSTCRSGVSKGSRKRWPGSPATPTP
jgi:acyl-CoA dehydrogenase